jgi:hypothetical protein
MLFAMTRFGELDMLVPAYAATIHKSQESEYPAVIIPVLTQHYAQSPPGLSSMGWGRIGPASSRRQPPSVLRARADCGGRLFAAKLAVVFEQRELHGTVTIRPELKISNQKLTQK